MVVQAGEQGTAVRVHDALSLRRDDPADLDDAAAPTANVEAGDALHFGVADQEHGYREQSE